MMLIVISLVIVLLLVSVLVVFAHYTRHDDGMDVVPSPVQDDGCCGTHLVCERETLLQTNAKVEYYDDEELDVLSGRDPETYTDNEYRQIRSVFDTLVERDVPGWCRSMQLRDIQLPRDIREEALLIVRERRR